jgi:hypothetical protein
MARPRKLSVSGLNVRIVDPNRRDYPELFRLILRTKIPVGVRGSDHLLLTQFGPDPSAEIPYTGILAKFTEIDFEAGWFDLDNLNKAEPDAIDQINIPAHLRPNYQAFYVNLFPESHLLVFETYSEGDSLGPTSVERWMTAVLKNRAVQRAFGNVEVTLVPDMAVLDQILDAPLRRLEMRIERTNPDDYDLATFERIEARLRANNARREEVVLVPDAGEHLTPDGETRELARVAAENGHVSALIDTPAGVRPRSTKGKPLAVQETYDREEVSTGTVFDRLSLEFVRRVLRTRRRRQ